jgi:hypothetical protein
LKFVLDENLSPRLINRLDRLSPGLTHVIEDLLRRSAVRSAMRTVLRTLVTGVVLFIATDKSLSASTPTDAQRKAAWSEYQKALSGSCSRNMVQDLTPADLNYFIEGYEAKLTAAQDRRFHEASKESCQGEAGGVACVNTGFLLSAEKDGYLAAFVDSLCHSGIHCTGPANCSIPKR